MPDLTAFATALSSLKTASDIAQLIKSSSTSLSEAENKMKSAELISSLADLKMELANLQQLIIDKDKTINDLNELINQKESVKFKEPFYYLENDPIPFCPTCFEDNKKLIHLTINKQTQHSSYYLRCRVCKNKYFRHQI